MRQVFLLLDGRGRCLHYRIAVWKPSHDFVLRRHNFGAEQTTKHGPVRLTTPRYSAVGECCAICYINLVDKVSALF